jgi:hypothetical protein
MPLVSSLGILNAIGFGFTSKKVPSVVIAHTTAPFISVYPFDLGFKTKYANPVTAITGTSAQWATFNNSNSVLAVANDASPFITAYRWSYGFGATYTNPSTLPAGTVNTAAFSIDGNYLVTGGINSPRINIYSFSAGNGFGTRTQLSPTNSTRGLAFNGSTTVLGCCGSTSPYIEAYAFSSAGAGTKYANPATAGQTAFNMAFTNNDSAVIATCTATPFVMAYKWSSGFGTKYSNPSTLPSSFGRGVATNINNDVVAVGYNGGLNVYSWNSTTGFGTKFANPAVTSSGQYFGVAFDKYNTNIGVAVSSGPYVLIYPWSASGFGTKYADPTTIPTGSGNSITFST